MCFLLAYIWQTPRVTPSSASNSAELGGLSNLLRTPFVLATAAAAPGFALHLRAFGALGGVTAGASTHPGTAGSPKPTPPQTDFRLKSEKPTNFYTIPKTSRKVWDLSCGAAGLGCSRGETGTKERIRGELLCCKGEE